jgi:outer membrane lipase/esterase
MRTLKRSLVAGAIALALSAPASAQFSGIYFFGDSLTDMGSFKPVLPPGTGLFTTNPGPMWALPFAQHYGFTATPANQGGNDYAYGGGNVTALPGYPDAPPTSSAVPIVTQISQHLAKGPLDPSAIYSVWGGANDMNATLEKVFTGQMTQAQAQAYMAGVAQDLVAQVARLSAAGARYIIVVDVPDVGKTPDAVDAHQSAAITAFAQYFNGLVRTGLDGLGIQTIRLNTFALLDEVMANPAAYGFTNSTQRACGATPALICTSANFVTPNAPQTYVYADGHHPTTALSAIFAQYAISVIDAPQQMALLGEQPLAVEQANWRALDGRMASAINVRSAGKFEAWAAYDYANPDYSSYQQSGNGDVNTISVGGDMKVNERLLVGVQFGYSEHKTDYGGANLKLREPMGTFYAGYGEGPWYLGATLGAGSLDYDTTRNIALGAATRTETGTTRGWQTVGRLLGGYWFNYAGFLHGPMLKLTYQEIRVRQFQENGTNSTTMTFGQQQVKSFVTSVGWQMSGQVGAIRPFGRATWEYDAKADPRDVTASVYGMGGSFSLPAYNADNSYALFNLGASTDFGKVTGYLTGSATAGKSDGNSYAVTVGIRVPL